MRKSHCIHGHEFTPENTLWYDMKHRNGKTYTHRACKTCRLVKARRQVAVRKVQRVEKKERNARQVRVAAPKIIALLKSLRKISPTRRISMGTTTLVTTLEDYLSDPLTNATG